MSCNNYFSPCSYDKCTPCVPCGPNSSTSLSPNSNLCPNLCSNPCPDTCNPCNPCYCPCPNVAFGATTPTPNCIPTIPVNTAPTPIPPGSTTIPFGTVTPITGFTGVPVTNVGGITVNTITGQFTIPLTGRYLVTAYFSIADNPSGTRSAYLYRVDGKTGVMSLIVVDSRNATQVGPTNITVQTVIEFNARDKLFMAVAQNSGTSLINLPTSRMVLTRLC